MRWVHVFVRRLCAWKWISVSVGVTLPAFVGIGLCVRAGWPPAMFWTPPPAPPALTWVPPTESLWAPPGGGGSVGTTGPQAAILPPPLAVAWRPPGSVGQLPPELRDTPGRPVNEPAGFVLGFALAVLWLVRASRAWR